MAAVMIGSSLTVIAVCILIIVYLLAPVRNPGISRTRKVKRARLAQVHICHKVGKKNCPLCSTLPEGSPFLRKETHSRLSIQMEWKNENELRRWAIQKEAHKILEQLPRGQGRLHSSIQLPEPDTSGGPIRSQIDPDFPDPGRRENRASKPPDTGSWCPHKETVPIENSWLGYIGELCTQCSQRVEPESLRRGDDGDGLPYLAF